MSPGNIYVDQIIAKIDRAADQINDFEVHLNKFIDSCTREIISKLSPDGSEEIWSFSIKEEVHYGLPIQIGEILHNLRSPLDQILSAIALQHAGAQTGVSFPRGKNRNSFEQALSKQSKLPSAVIEVIRESKPYEEGGDPILYSLMEMNRRDKHRVGLVPVQMPAQLTMSYCCFWVGVPLVIGNKKGAHLLVKRPSAIENLGFTGRPQALYSTRPVSLLFDTGDKTWQTELDFMTTTPGAMFEHDTNMLINFAFDEPSIRGQPVCRTLGSMLQRVTNIVSDLRVFVH